MSKIDIVREWFKSAPDGVVFTTESLAAELGVEMSDITNVSSYTLRHNVTKIVSPENGEHKGAGKHYNLNANMAKMYFKEFPLGSKSYDDGVRAGNRNPDIFVDKVISLDEEIDRRIEQYREKIKMLQSIKNAE